MAPKGKRNAAKRTQLKKAQNPPKQKTSTQKATAKSSVLQPPQRNDPQSPARIIFDAHGVDLNRGKEAALRKATCGKLNLIWTTGKPPTTAKNATTLLERRLAEYYNSNKQQEKERKECERRGLSIEGDGVTLRKRRFEAESNSTQLQGGGKRARESEEARNPIEPPDFTSEEIFSFLKRRKLDNKGTDCERRLRLVVSELTFLQKHCKKEWDSLFFGYKSVNDLLQRAKAGIDAKRKASARNAPKDTEIQLMSQDTLRIVPNADEKSTWMGHFRQQNVIGDGNCMFRAFAAVYWGNQKYHKLVRRQVQQLWESVCAGEVNAGNPAADMRRQLYYALLVQSTDNVVEGEVRGPRNSPLDAQVENDGYWGSHEMLQLLTDVYDIEIVVHSPQIRISGHFIGSWFQIVRGSNPDVGHQRRQYHIANYLNSSHYTALFPIVSKDRFYDPDNQLRFNLHERPESGINRPQDVNNKGQYEPAPLDMLYGVINPRQPLDPRWLSQYPDEEDDQEGEDEEDQGEGDGEEDDEEEDNDTDEDDAGDDQDGHDSNSDGDNCGMSSNYHNGHGSNSKEGDDGRGQAGAAVHKQQSRSKSPRVDQHAHSGVLYNTTPSPFVPSHPSTSPKSARKVVGLIDLNPYQTPYYAHISTPIPQPSPRSLKPASAHLRSPTEFSFLRKAIRDGNKRADYETGTTDLGSLQGVKAMPFDSYGDWVQYKLNPELYSRFAPMYRRNTPGFDDYGRVGGAARQRHRINSPRSAPHPGARRSPSFQYARPVAAAEWSFN